MKSIVLAWGRHKAEEVKEGSDLNLKRCENRSFSQVVS